MAASVFLANSAQAVVTLVGDTTITFDNANLNLGDQIPGNFGSNATNSGGGITIGNSGLGLGTPDITLSWKSQFNGFGHQSTQFEYVNVSGTDGGFLNNSVVGQTHEIQFSPGANASLILSSLDFQSVGVTADTYTYTLTVKDAGTSSILASVPVVVAGDGNKTAPINLGVHGVLGQSLVLDISRTGGTGDGFSMAVDDIAFSEVVPEPTTTALMGLGLGGLGLMAVRRWRK